MRRLATSLLAILSLIDEAVGAWLGIVPDVGSIETHKLIRILLKPLESCFTDIACIEIPGISQKFFSIDHPIELY